MTEKTDLPNISMANTKKELLEAYEEAKERFESLSKDLLDGSRICISPGRGDGTVGDILNLLVGQFILFGQIPDLGRL